MDTSADLDENRLKFLQDNVLGNSDKHLTFVCILNIYHKNSQRY